MDNDKLVVVCIATMDLWGPLHDLLLESIDFCLINFMRSILVVVRRMNLERWTFLKTVVVANNILCYCVSMLGYDSSMNRVNGLSLKIWMVFMCILFEHWPNYLCFSWKLQCPSNCMLLWVAWFRGFLAPFFGVSCLYCIFC